MFVARLRIESRAGQRWLSGLFGVLGVVVAGWGLSLAVTATSQAADGEGWDPGFIRGLGVFLAWDLSGIGLGIFFRGHNQTIGIELAPELPLEEPIFLVFLCYLVMNLFQLFRRLLAARLPHTEKVEERS